MDMSDSTRLRLEPADEGMHPVEEAVNFNESMYVNVFDHAQQLGGWFRVGNRPNEGHAEMSCCVYLPDGRVGFMHQRPPISDNAALDRAGMRFEVLEPFARMRVTYRGSLCVLGDPQAMRDPKRAFRENPVVAAEVQLDLEGVSPMFGGEQVDADRQPVQEAPEDAFARGHYEQHVRGRGHFVVGTERFTVDGLGLRDHSWGPRYWQNLLWYRWLPMSFTEDFALNVSVVTLRTGAPRVWGMVLTRGADGEKRYDHVVSGSVESDYGDGRQALGQRVQLRTASGRDYVVEGRALACIPLRNRRKQDDGVWLETRITEAMTRYVCDGHVGYGMAEYLDQMNGEEPAGYPT